VPKREPASTTAERLVGTWEVVSIDGLPASVNSAWYFEFTKDNKIIVTVLRPGKLGNSKSVRTGIYEVIDDKIRIELDSNPDGLGRFDTIVLSSIKEDQCVLVARSGDSDISLELKRNETPLKGLRYWR
jgi:hypothetical protein